MVRYPVDPDRGPGDVPVAKQAVVMDRETFKERAEDRAGLRDLDVQVEQMSLTRQQKDAHRAAPRENTDELGAERMRRRLPEAGQQRDPLSSRQRKARSVAKRQAISKLPQAQYEAMSGLVTGSREQWDSTNGSLSDAAGDVEQLDERQARQVRRIDRAIQQFERRNDRGHVIYSDLVLPTGVNSGNAGGFLKNQFDPGTVVEFDRYTAGTHCLHELDGKAKHPGRTGAMEIQTRRGAYLGASDSRDDTRHLLPRSMRLEVVGSHVATYRRPDGSEGTRQVLQLRDIDEGATP